MCVLQILLLTLLDLEVLLLQPLIMRWRQHTSMCRQTTRAVVLQVLAVIPVGIRFGAVSDGISSACRAA